MNNKKDFEIQALKFDDMDAGELFQIPVLVMNANLEFSGNGLLSENVYDGVYGDFDPHTTVFGFFKYNKDEFVGITSGLTFERKVFNRTDGKKNEIFYNGSTGLYFENDMELPLLPLNKARELLRDVEYKKCIEQFISHFEELKRRDEIFEAKGHMLLLQKGMPTMEDK